MSLLLRATSRFVRALTVQFVFTVFTTCSFVFVFPLILLLSSISFISSALYLLCLLFEGYVKVGNKGGDSYTASVVTAPSVCPETGGRMKVLGGHD